MRFVQQPGPVEPERHVVAQTNAIEVTIELKAGQTILSGLATEIERLGANSAYLLLQDATVQQLEFVMPAPSPDVEHTAWWSETHCLAEKGRIVEAGMVFGWRDNGPFIHCHGSWTYETGDLFAGHMLPDRCVLKDTATFSGWVFTNARFEGGFDPETNFTLFLPNATNKPIDANAALIRLRPNVEIGQELAKICEKLGWENVKIQGIGSLIGASFDDGEILESYATEFLVRQGSIRLEDSQHFSDIDVLIVGIGGEIMQGSLLRDENAVLMTCELVLLRAD